MDDLIQVIIFIVTGLIFVASAFRKKKRLTTNPLEQDSKSDIFGIEDLIGQPEGIKNEVPAEKVVPPKPEENKKQDFNNNRITNKQTTDNHNKQTQNSYDWDEDPELFDLRSAVIYSEILNRKSF